jgi:hypothetical protein
MIQLFLWLNPFSQVILSCEKQNDCLQGNYCSIKNLCYTCSYITKYYCDSLNGCCNIEFLNQCSTIIYQCPNPIKQDRVVPSYHLHLFLIFFIMFCSLYLSIGCYCNKCIENKKGWDILPNKESWKSLFSLVEDGIYFSFSNIRRCLRNRRYTSIQN